jgi:hypothetical protein
MMARIHTIPVEASKLPRREGLSAVAELLIVVFLVGFGFLLMST